MNPLLHKYVRTGWTPAMVLKVVGFNADLYCTSSLIPTIEFVAELVAEETGGSPKDQLAKYFAEYLAAEIESQMVAALGLKMFLEGKTR